MGDNVVKASQGLTEFRVASRAFEKDDMVMLGASVKEGLDKDSKTHRVSGRDADGARVDIDLSNTFLNASSKVAAYGFATITPESGPARSGAFYYSEGPTPKP